ncbi:MAG: sulfotransferase, partial [Desulfobacterales bacterium]|nr:sulfotransferase [Desulfobacterales bacterium]
MLIGEFKGSKSQLQNICEICSEYISPVTLPIALISQVQRSGGSLLSQLFDGHPELHAHPHELKIGYPKKYMWPKIDLNEHPQRWLEMLFEDKVIEHSKGGYKKERKQDEVFPFIFMPSVQRRVFLGYLSSVDSIILRDVFDAYMTSYFGAWINNQNRHGQKKYVTAFTPRLAMIEDNMESFFEVYPDGRLLSIVRDPKNWYPSAARHRSDVYGDIRKSIDLWKTSTRAALRNKEKYGERVCIVRFEDLVSKTESVMSYMADFLGINFDNIL